MSEGVERKEGVGDEYVAWGPVPNLEQQWGEGEMKWEAHGTPGTTGYALLYECGHLTVGEYAIDRVINLGPHTNLLVCKHCWCHIKGLVATEIVEDLAKKLDSEAVVQLLSQREKEDAIAPE